MPKANVKAQSKKSPLSTSILHYEISTLSFFFFMAAVLGLLAMDGSLFFFMVVFFALGSLSATLFLNLARRFNAKIPVSTSILYHGISTLGFFIFLSTVNTGLTFGALLIVSAASAMFFNLSVPSTVLTLVSLASWLKGKITGEKTKLTEAKEMSYTTLFSLVITTMYLTTYFASFLGAALGISLIASASIVFLPVVVTFSLVKLYSLAKRKFSGESNSATKGDETPLVNGNSPSNDKQPAATKTEQTKAEANPQERRDTQGGFFDGSKRDSKDSKSTTPTDGSEQEAQHSPRQ